MKTQKNFPRKISYIGTTYEGNFFGDFFQYFEIFPTLCSTLQHIKPIVSVNGIISSIGFTIVKINL